MNTYLTFLLGNESFAVSVSNVLEVLQKRQVTKVPKTPEHIRGIINFRGDILPVVDTRRKFAMEILQDTEKYIVIVFEITNSTKKISIAATADAVKDVIEIKENEIKEVPELGLSFDSQFIQGAIRRNDEFILLLNIEKVFSATNLAEIQSLQKSAQPV